MKKILILLALLFTVTADAGSLFYRAQDGDSVIIGPICVPELAGEQYYAALDFDTSGLVIDIYASGDGVGSSFSYTTTDIDNYDDTPPAWGDPTTNAVEVEALDDCIRLHIRDEILAVSNATEWTIKFTDAGVLIMDYTVQILALATQADAQADAQVGADAALVANNLDHLMLVAVTGTDVIDDTVIAFLVSDDATADWDSYNNQTDSLEAAQIDITTVITDIGTMQTDLSIITGTTGVLIDQNAVDADAIASNAIDADAIATDAIGASEIAANAIGASEIAANAIGPSEIADNAIDANALAASAVDEIWDEVIETAGLTYTGRCIMAALAAYVAGEFNTAGNTTTYQDTGGNSTRIVGTVTASGRTTMSITCP